MFIKSGFTYTFFRAMPLVFIVFLFSCNTNPDVNTIKEGEIEFEIDYLDSERENPLISLLPRKMITEFKNNSTNSIIVGFFGTFKLSYITNHNNGRNATLFQILDKKYMYEADTSAAPFGYPDTTNVKIKYTGKTKKIAGYICNHAIAVYSNTNDTVQLYYTKQLEIENPNSNNPYKQLKNVLLEFSVKMVGINMKFSAKKIKKIRVDKKKFDISKDYKKVSKSEMEKIVNEYNKMSGK
ncbi:MAG: hypothetical protein B6I20_01900 [Bacteroidetes bacterium 4572_117]|nr:MAG: hypothetical protein B6I20_01900 [Bacteroidetes bacterium 4572_117]